MTTNSPLMNNSPTPNTEGLAIGLSVAASVLGLALMSVIVAVIALVMLKRYRGEYRVSQHTGNTYQAAHVMSRFLNIGKT